MLIALEFCFGVYLWKNTKPKVILGFLVKNGQEYVVAWKDDVNGYTTHSYRSLSDARRFAREELKLSEGINPVLDGSLERAWVQDRSGGFVVLWKTMTFRGLHQLTFNSWEDANYFMGALRQGFYTPSPYGHSILFLPRVY